MQPAWGRRPLLLALHSSDLLAHVEQHSNEDLGRSLTDFMAVQHLHGMDIVKELGAGGQASVYLCKDRWQWHLQGKKEAEAARREGRPAAKGPRLVAVKVLKKYAMTPKEQEMVGPSVDEVRNRGPSAGESGLTHQLVPAHDAGDQGGGDPRRRDRPPQRAGAQGRVGRQVFQ